MVLNLDSIPVHESGVIGRIIDSDATGRSEAVLVIPAEGKVKVLNDVGARIWTLSDGTRTVQGIVEVICQEYEVLPDQAKEDTIQFLDELLGKRAIRLLQVLRK